MHEIYNFVGPKTLLLKGCIIHMTFTTPSLGCMGSYTPFFNSGS